MRMKNKKYIAISCWCLLSPLSMAGESMLWLGYNQNTTDFFGDGNSQIKPDGTTIGFSTELSDQWAVTISYADFNGNTTETVFENALLTLDNFGETSSTSKAVSFNWIGDDFSLTFTYSQFNNDDKSLTRLPLVLEDISSDDKVYSASYDRLTELGSWEFGWSLGTQFAKSSVTSNAVVGENPPLRIAAEFNNESVSAFLDLDFSYPIKQQSISITPKFTLSWAAELSNSGDQLVTVTRGDVQQRFTQLNDRLTATFRTPDSGFWETAIDVEWDNGWGATLAYGQSIAADIDVDSISFEISVAF